MVKNIIGGIAVGIANVPPDTPGITFAIPTAIPPIIFFTIIFLL